MSENDQAKKEEQHKSRLDFLRNRIQGAAGEVGEKLGAAGGQAVGSAGGAALGGGAGAAVGGLRGALSGAAAGGVGAIPGAIVGAGEGAAEFGARGAKAGGRFGRKVGSYMGRRVGEQAVGGEKESLEKTLRQEGGRLLGSSVASLAGAVVPVAGSTTGSFVGGWLGEKIGGSALGKVIFWGSIALGILGAIVFILLCVFILYGDFS